MPRGNRTIRPSTVARFKFVSVIASGFVKLLFNSVITACKSAGLNESTNCLVVGFLAGEGDGAAGGLDAIDGGSTGCVGAGDAGVGD
jgi:hypothetical protein